MTRDVRHRHDTAHIGNVPASQLGELTWKTRVRVATTVNGTLATAYENGDTIDGVVLATGNRILLKDQTTGSAKGIYTVNASGAPTRATDFDETADLSNGAVIFVDEGTVNANTIWYLFTNPPITVGTTSLSFVQFRTLSDAVPGDTAAAGVGSAGTSADVSRSDHRHGQGGFSAVAATDSAPGDVAATGSSGSVARRDHLHGRETVAALDPDDVRDAGRWEVVMVPGVTSPPDPVQTAAGDDWVYSWVPG